MPSTVNVFQLKEKNILQAKTCQKNSHTMDQGSAEIGQLGYSQKACFHLMLLGLCDVGLHLQDFRFF